MIHSIVIRVALLSVVLLPMRALATPFDAARVPADADGVGHLDMDILRRTALHRLALPRLLGGSHWKDMDAKVRPLARALLDAAQGISFWIAGRDSGAAVIQVADGRRIQGLFEKVPHKGEVRIADHLARKVHFSGGDGNVRLVAMLGNLLIVARDESSMAKAIDALSARGKPPTATRLPEGAFERGVFFFTALNDQLLDRVKDRARAQTLQVTMTSLTVQAREVRSELRIRAKVTMASPENAQQVKNMVEAALALASVSNEAAELRPITKGLTVVATGNVVEVCLAVPSAELVEIVASRQ